jgi:hypothetical protein
MTVLAVLARKQVVDLAEVTTAEGNEEGVWANAKMVSLCTSFLFSSSRRTLIGSLSAACAVLFGLMALSSLFLSFLVLSDLFSPTTSNILKHAWVGSTGYAIFVVAWCLAGAIMSFGSVAGEIKTVWCVFLFLLLSSTIDSLRQVVLPSTKSATSRTER